MPTKKSILVIPNLNIIDRRDRIKDCYPIFETVCLNGHAVKLGPVENNGTRTIFLKSEGDRAMKKIAIVGASNDLRAAAILAHAHDLGYKVELISEAPKKLQDWLSKIKEIPIIAPPVFELHEDPKTGRELRRERRKKNKGKTFTQSLKKKR